ncbi:MAG: hypothetical protein ACLU99_08625 [Alphaproteobacteria bacterium]
MACHTNSATSVWSSKDICRQYRACDAILFGCDCLVGNFNRYLHCYGVFICDASICASGSSPPPP